MISQTSYDVVDHIYSSLTALLNYYVGKHSKVLAVRFDVHYPAVDIETDCLSNLNITRFIAKLVQKFKRDGLDPVYMWVREQTAHALHPHYHCLLLLNGNKTKSATNVFHSAEQLWGSTIQHNPTGLIHYCTRQPDGTPQLNGRIIQRSEGIPDYLERQISYLAKPYSKGEYNDGLRDFGTSRLPH